MKNVKIIRMILGAPSLLLAFYLWYLMLSHVKATELMWFVWIITIPLIIVLTVLEKIMVESE